MELEAFVTNLGKYGEGDLAGEYLKLPATTEQVQALLKRIGVDGVRYEEIFITAYQTDIPGLAGCLGEYENLDELNYLAVLLEDMNESERELFAAAVDFGEHTGGAKDLINLAQNLDCYDLHPGVGDEEALGRIYIEDMEMLDVPENILPYFDFEAYGRDVAISENGHFCEAGYLFYSGGFEEVYAGRADIPEENRIFAYPKLNILETMRAYKEVMAKAAESAEKRPTEKSHEER